MSAFPDTLRTERLTLRRWRVEDAGALRAAIDASDAHLRPFIPWMRDEPRTLEQTRERVAGFIVEYDAGVTFQWAVWRGEVLVGEVMLMTRAGPDALDVEPVAHTGRGYMREAVRALVALSDAVDNPRLEAWCAVTNSRSSAVVEALGFSEARRADDAGITYRVFERHR